MLMKVQSLKNFVSTIGNSRTFRNMKILGISTDHDASFTILKEGKGSVFELERHTGIKRYSLSPYDKSSFIKLLSKFLQKEEISSFDVVAVSTRLKPDFDARIRLILREIGVKFKDFMSFHHKDCHIASTFYTSKERTGVGVCFDDGGNGT
jgi:predicted NodU family carbamoyl transferase